MSRPSGATLRGVLGELLRGLRRVRSRLSWDRRWRDPDFQPVWRVDGPRAFVRALFEEGQLAAGQTLLEIGCGVGDGADWLARQGIDVLAVDFSPRAIARARARFGERRGLRFQVVDVCAESPVQARFDLLCDTGCLHGLGAELRRGYRDNVLRWSHPGTRLFIIMHTVDTPEQQHRDEVR